jgi:hypothetical protein
VEAPEGLVTGTRLETGGGKIGSRRASFKANRDAADKERCARCASRIQRGQGKLRTVRIYLTRPAGQMNATCFDQLLKITLAKPEPSTTDISR